jgi:hypothetical protein
VPDCPGPEALGCLFGPAASATNGRVYKNTSIPETIRSKPEEAPSPSASGVSFSRKRRFSAVHKKINIGATLHSRGDAILIRNPWNQAKDQHTAGSRVRSWRKRLFSGLLIAVVLVIVCAPVLALAPPPGGGFARFSQGIPVWWPYHAALMVTGFILLAAGFITAHYHKTKNWFRTHKILQITGAFSIFAGIFVGVSMVTLSDFPHLTNLHEQAGLAIGILRPIMIILGFSIFRVKKSMNTVRKSHRWLGRALIALILINIVLGVTTLLLILGL